MNELLHKLSGVGRQLGIGLGIAAAFWLGTRCAGPGEAPPETTDPHADHAAEAARVWTCSMHPQIRMSEPGQCPICGMDLVPAEDVGPGDGSEHVGQDRRVTLSPQARALAQVRTTKVARTEPRGEVRLLGRVDYDETRLRMVTPWTGGRIDRLNIRVTGARVKRGQTVAMLYSPEVYGAMRDLVVARKQTEKLQKGMHGAADMAGAALEAARERLRLLGVPDSLIGEVERGGKVPRNIPIRSQSGGTVLKRLVEQGDYVKAGQPLYHVADLGRVWVQIDAYESDLPHLRPGLDVLIQVQSLPDEPFTGKVAFIDPVVDPKTRTTRVRVEVDNASGQIRPGMFAEAVIETGVEGGEGMLTIPTESVLFTGVRSVVYVELAGQTGTYELREVRLGPQAGPVFPVLAGLSEGERVVSRGAFMVDADLQLAGGRSMMTLGDDRSDAEGLEVTPQTLAELAPVMEAYLEAEVALTKDELDAARAGLQKLAKVVTELDPTGSRKVREAWQKIASDLSGHARHAAATKDEGELRTAFEHVSMAATSLLRTFGNPSDAPVRLAFCPMAFDNQGAEWIQAEDVVANPYYGSSMLRCGEFKATILPGEALATGAHAPPPAAAPAGHDH